MTSSVPRLDLAQLTERYDVVLMDSYGVLVDGQGALPGAVDLLTRLDDSGQRWMVLSNDASHLPSTAVRRYRERGLPISTSRLLTSGDLIAPHFAAHGLTRKRCVVLGPPDSHALVEEAGGLLVPADDPDLQVLVICDDDGYPFVRTVETLVGTLYARFDTGDPVHLVLPNPDWIYPRAPGRFGITAGSVAGLLEQALRLRFPDDPPRFSALGKPHAPMFERAMAALGVRPEDRVVMLGDQLATDIAGAHAMGIDSVLVGTGVCDPTRLPATGPRPTWWMPGVQGASTHGG